MAKLLLPTSIALALLAHATTAKAAHSARPNIILVLADDLGAQELGCYGNKEHATPNLNRLASEGARFETFYANPLCTPTRMALMTGQYGFRNGYLGMSNPAFIPKKDSPLHAIGNHFTHADLLKSAGYRTALSGKWQLPGSLPTLIYDAGFDEYRMWAYDHNLPPDTKHPAHEKAGQAARYWHPSILENGKYLPTTPEDYGPDLFNDYVINFAKKTKDAPFFAYYTSVLTHSPHLETPDPAQPEKRRPANFRSNLEYLDHLMGKLMLALRENGLEENTYLIFIGDNGTGGAGKGSVTERGARTPCIIRGPHVKKGLVSPAVADLTDIFPTLAAIAGATPPESVKQDGHSLLPVLRGEKERHRDWIYSHLDDGRILRDERWLLEMPKAGGKERFFDCGTRRDGIGYQEVTQSEHPEAQAARARFARILESIPKPLSHTSASTPDSFPKPSPSATNAERATRFRKRDLDGNGSLSLEEFLKTIIANDPKAAERRFKSMDKDNDGKLSLNEFSSAP
jgi:arylsulfatase A